MSHLDITKVLYGRAARESREGEPIKQVLAVWEEIDGAITHLLQNSDTRFQSILERSIPIISVTTIETYYRDMLDGIFRVCSPNFYKPILNEIHKDKYDINDLVTLHEKSIHPLEMVSVAQNFQSVEAIEKVFSKFMKKGFWNSVLGAAVRAKEAPDQIVEIKNEYLESLRKLFKLRHELVHNPNHNLKIITEDLRDDIAASFMVVFASDLQLNRMFHENMDDEIRETIDKA